MTPRNLFNIILKIIGILYIKDFLQTLSEVIQLVVQYRDRWDNLSIPVFSAFQLFVYGGLIYYFIFKTDYIINKFRLDEGITQDMFVFNIHRSTVLSLAIIITGGLLILNAIPFLLNTIFSYVQQKNLMSYEKPDYSYMIIYSAKIVLGLILVGNHTLLVNYIERKRKNGKDIA